MNSNMKLTMTTMLNNSKLLPIDLFKLIEKKLLFLLTNLNLYYKIYSL